MKVVAVIPARYASSRFPGKPLVDLNGKTMIRRIHELVAECEGIDAVLVATDDERIFDHVTGFGGRAVMTSPECPSGTDRVAEAIKDIEADIIINVQGDQVIMDTAAVGMMVKELRAGCGMATIAVKAAADEIDDPNCVKVVCDLKGTALYFSRSALPYVRNAGFIPTYKHVGLYGFRRAVLERFTALTPGALEQAESLEQLRALENAIPIRVIIASGKFEEINAPADRERLLKFWQD